jgi:hypothetical protein
MLTPPPRHPFADGWYLHISLADLRERLRPLVPVKPLAAVAERLYARSVDPGVERALFAQVAARTAPAAPASPPAAGVSPLGVLPAPRPGERTLALAWPQEVGPDEVARWLRKYAPAPVQAQPVCHVLPQLADPTTTPERLQALDPLVRTLGALAAHAYLAWKAVQTDLKRPAIGIDARRAHHTLLTHWNRLPKRVGRRTVPLQHVPAKRHEDGVWRFEILAPERAGVKLALRADWVRSAGEAVTATIRRWKGAEGLRHWAALLRLLAVQGGRTGRVRWSLDTHLDALGYAAMTRRDPALRKRVAALVELFTQLELAVYAADGTLRSRLPILVVTAKHDRLRGTDWALEGMELDINPWLYRGVRTADGQLGEDWYPAPVELARVDHARFPYALGLGLILAIRWRWDWRDGRDHCALKGRTLLETAGIPYRRHEARETWTTLQSTLEALIRCGALGHYTWEGTAWTLDGTCKLYPAQWARERTVHGLRPQELRPPTCVFTGEELKAWRKARGWSQARAAKELGVGIATLKRAEAPDARGDLLGATLADALAEVQARERATRP